MRDVSMSEIREFSTEQMASLILCYLQRNFNGSFNPLYSKGSLSAILAFEIAPIWLGKNVNNGCLIQGSAVIAYAGDIAPKELNDFFYRAVVLLKQQDFIVQDETQTNSDFIKLTDQGKQARINDSSMTLIIERDTNIIHKWYKDSVFLIEIKKGEDTHQGTAFLTKNEKLLTCKHVLSDATSWKILIDESTEFDADYFDVLHTEKDVSILNFKSSTLNSILKEKKPIIPSIERPQVGDRIITLGYPRIPQRRPTLCTDEGMLQANTADYRGSTEYLTFNNRIDGGCSGGAAIDRQGMLVGVITELTSSERESTDSPQAINSFGHAIPIKYFNSLL